MKENVIVASRLCRQFEIDDVIVEAISAVYIRIEAKLISYKSVIINCHQVELRIA